MKRILLLFMTLLSIAGADACRHKTYKIDFSGQEYAYAEPQIVHRTSSNRTSKVDPWLSEQGLMPARAEHKAGEEVVLYFTMVATDTDYRFILDGTEIRPEYDSRKGFIIRFTMPEHDVTLRYLQRNSMNEIPEPWR